MDRNNLLLGTISGDCVVPYVGTWIEICNRHCRLKSSQSRSLRGNVDRNFDNNDVISKVSSRSLRGNVDRNDRELTDNPNTYCRSLRGNVDRNICVVEI